MSKTYNEMKEKIITVVFAVLLILSVVLNWYQNKTLNKAMTTIQDLQEVMHLTDSTLVIETDTIWMEKVVVDSMPKERKQTVMALDTVYQQHGDTIEATPRLLTLKKKIIAIQ